MIVSSGITVYKGIEIAPAFIHREVKLQIEKSRIEPQEIDEAISRFDFICQQSKQELETLKEKAETEQQLEEVEIFDAHLMMADDPMLLSKIKDLIQKELYSVEHAIEAAKTAFTAMFLTIEDPYLKARAVDVADVTNRFLRIALGVKSNSFEGIQEAVLLFAKDLKPSETSGLTSFIKGIILEEGSPTSHAAIIAKAKGIPTIVGISEILETVNDGDMVILDAISNKVYIKPEKETIVSFKKQREDFMQKKQSLAEIKSEEAITKDGRRIKLYGNIGTSLEAASVIDNGGKGIGLFRTEFLYMNAKNFPTEEEQFKEYKKALEIGPEELIIRTLDIGGDKNLPYYQFPQEANPFLGLRALRFTLANTDLFKTQLRAILRASAFGPASIMFPMVSSLDEVQRAKAVLELCKEELRQEQLAFDPNIRVGIMIEIPSAVIIADILIEEVDFFSIGTNDLCQYTLAVDRMNKEVAYLYQPLHPGILRLIRQTVQAAHQANKEVGICGEMAGEALNTLVLIGLGVDELSMSPAVIPEIKSLIRQINYEEAKQITNLVLNCKSTDEINSILDMEVKKYAN
jgi:phosphotransferase system enzyme I (PtsI)